MQIHRSASVRLCIGGILAVVITAALFFVMQYLVQGNEVQLDEKPMRKIADIVMGDSEIEVNAKEKKPDKPEETEEQPPEIEQPDLQDLDVNADSINIMPSLKTDLNLNQGPGLSASDGEYLPMAKVQPQYPRRALSRNIEGYCIVEYTVTKVGSVRDSVAIDCSPRGMFERASVKASLKFKYKPRVENGEAIEVSGVRNKFTYRLAK